MNAKITLSCVTFLMAIAAPAFGQSCGRSVVVSGNPVYSAPVIVQQRVTVAHHEIITPVAIPVALPVVVPAFTYQYAPPACAAASVGHPGVGQYPVAQGFNQGYQMPGNAQPGAVVGYGPPAAPTYQGPYQQGPSAPQLGTPGVTDDNARVKALAKQLLEEMRRQEASSPADDGPPMAVTPPGLGNSPLAPASGPPASPEVAVQSVRPNPSSQFAQPAINALHRNCATCHTGIGSKGEAMIFSQTDRLNPDAPFRSMLTEITTGRMPTKQSNFKPTPDELQVIEAWLSGR